MCRDIKNQMISKLSDYGVKRWLIASFIRANNSGRLIVNCFLEKATSFHFNGEKQRIDRLRVIIF